MPPATQREALPNDIESLIRRLGQELSCSICLNVFEDPTMTPCNHTFCRECIERAVTLTKKSSTVPLNQCPICKSKTPKRSLNPSPAASKLCSIYEEIVRAYSDLNGGDDNWIHEAGIRGNDAYYTGGGAPLENLSQLYPYPEKPKKSDLKESDLKEVSETECESDLLTDLDEDDITQLENNNNNNETSRIYDETTQLTNSNVQKLQQSTNFVDIPSSPLIYPTAIESQQLTCDRLIINTQELEKLAAINDSIDKELEELEKKLAATTGNSTIIEEESTDNSENQENNYKSAKNEKEKDAQPISIPKVKVNKTKSKTLTAVKKPKLSVTPVEDIEVIFDPKEIPTAKVKSASKVAATVKALTTTGIKDEKSLVQLTKFSDKFNCPVLPDLQSPIMEVTHLLTPAGSNLIIKKRTMKYFEALILKKEIISFDWINSCLKAGKLLPSSDYKIKGDEIGMKQRRKQSPEDCDYQKIFSPFKFYFYGEFNQPPRDQLEQLMIASKCTILTNVNDLTRGSIVLADPTSQFTFEKDADIIKKYPIISPNWFLDSISCGKALEFGGYLIL